MQKTLGLVLKKQNIGETDRILTIFSPTLGKKRVIARAVRKPLSKLAGHLDTLMLSQIILTDEADLPKITSAVLVESFESLRLSLPNLERAFALTQIIERVIIEDVSQQSVFQVTMDALVRLNDDHSWPAVWLTFLSKLTDTLGLNVTDFQCERCAAAVRDEAYWLSDERVFRCLQCGAGAGALKLSGQTIKLLHVLKMRPYPFIQRLQIPAVVAQQTEEIYLREITEWFNKPWRSYATLQES